MSYIAGFNCLNCCYLRCHRVSKITLWGWKISHGTHGRPLGLGYQAGHTRAFQMALDTPIDTPESMQEKCPAL